MFLKAVWYVAAWAHELSDRPLAVTIIGERVVLFRGANDQSIALEDACPHRRLPLSMGRVEGGLLRCGYHGLTFGADGECVRAPCADKVPQGARVRSYPVEERYGLIWIWMGAREDADPATIFPVEHWGDASWGMSQGDSMQVRCNYLHLTDNLLDPSHVSWVHASTFASSACEATPLTVEAREDGVTVGRWMLASDVAPFYAPFVRFSGKCDRKQHYEVRFPSLAIIKAVLAPAGTGGEGKSLPPETFLMDSYNFMTPIDEHKTRYFWFQIRNFAPGDEAVSSAMSAAVRAAFEEDRVILEAIDIAMGDNVFPKTSMIIDRGPIQFRRRLSQLIELEAADGRKAPDTAKSAGLHGEKIVQSVLSMAD